MKLELFNRICKENWLDERGDIIELHLTEESFDELYEDILKNRAGPVSIVHPHWDLINPATRSAVKVRVKGSGGDTMLVEYGGWKQHKNARLYGVPGA